MKSSLLMNFSVDKENKKIKVEREFAAPLPKVWAAWTDPKLLDQWWAPRPWKARTKTMDFRPGGYWLYAMVGPDNSEHWAKLDYKTISPQKQFSGQDAFSDPNGNVNKELPRSMWTNVFKPNNDSTIVNIEISYDKLDDLEKILEMGMREGFTAAMENLDELFAKD